MFIFYPFDDFSAHFMITSFCHGDLIVISRLLVLIFCPFNNFLFDADFLPIWLFFARFIQIFCPFDWLNRRMSRWMGTWLIDWMIERPTIDQEGRVHARGKRGGWLTHLPHLWMVMEPHKGTIFHLSHGDPHKGPTLHLSNGDPHKGPAQGDHISPRSVGPIQETHTSSQSGGPTSQLNMGGICKNNSPPILLIPSLIILPGNKRGNVPNRSPTLLLYPTPLRPAILIHTITIYARNSRNYRYFNS